MKITLLQEFEFSKWKPCCLTCKFRGNASLAYDPRPPGGPEGQRSSYRVTGVKCGHPTHPKDSVNPDDICKDFDAVHEVLRRLFSTRKLI